MSGIALLLIAQQAFGATAPTFTTDSAAASETVAAVAAGPETNPQEQEPAPDRWSSAIDLGFASSNGNSNLVSLTTGLRISHLQTSVFKLEWAASLRYGESDGVVVARNFQSKLDFDAGPGAVIAPFAFVSAERDAFRRLDLRARAGSGVKYTFYRAEPGEASLRVAAQWNRENFTPDAALDPRNDGAWSVEFKGKRGVGSAVRLENTAMFSPVFDDVADYNVEIGSKVSSKVSEHLALTLTHAYSFDSTPALGVGRTDQRFQAGLTIDF